MVEDLQCLYLKVVLGNRMDSSSCLSKRMLMMTGQLRLMKDDAAYNEYVVFTVTFFLKDCLWAVGLFGATRHACICFYVHTYIHTYIHTYRFYVRSKAYTIEPVITWCHGMMMESDKSGMWLPKTGTPIEVAAVGRHTVKMWVQYDTSQCEVIQCTLNLGDTIL